MSEEIYFLFLGISIGWLSLFLIAHVLVKYDYCKKDDKKFKMTLYIAPNAICTIYIYSTKNLNKILRYKKNKTSFTITDSSQKTLGVTTSMVQSFEYEEIKKDFYRAQELDKR